MRPAYANGYSYSYSHRYRNSNSDANCYCDTEGNARTKGSAHSGSTPVTLNLLSQ
jgi:hypothetical protein